MSKIDEYREFLRSVRSSLGYWKSYSLLQFTSSITSIMKLDGVSGRALASRLGVSAAQVSKVLRGNENVTIETMARFAHALDAVVYVHVAKRGVRVQWTESKEPETSTARASALPSNVADMELFKERTRLGFSAATKEDKIDVDFSTSFAGVSRG
jgi:transcriptional regulator with XRE-family HTH domain